MITGRGLDTLPDDTIGVPMEDNNAPLAYRDTTSRYYLMRIVEKSPNRLVMQADAEVQHDAALSIGGILSADRTAVYWVNDTNPIP